MNPNKDIELIEKYLNNELGVEEKQAFDDRLLEEKELAAEFERHQIAHKALDFIVARNLREQLSALEAEDKVVSINRGRSRRMFFIRSAAAAVILLMIGFFYFFFPLGKTSSVEMAATYYEMPDFDSRRSADESGAQDALSRGINALRNGDYAQAIATLDSVNVTNAFSLTAQYHQAHALHLNGQYNQAELLFDEVSAGNDPRLNEAAEWYGLLSCLAQDKNCNVKLDSIAEDTGHPYYEQASAIRKGLQ